VTTYKVAKICVNAWIVKQLAVVERIRSAFRTTVHGLDAHQENKQSYKNKNFLVIFGQMKNFKKNFLLNTDYF